MTAVSWYANWLRSVVLCSFLTRRFTAAVKLDFLFKSSFSWPPWGLTFAWHSLFFQQRESYFPTPLRSSFSTELFFALCFVFFPSTLLCDLMSSMHGLEVLLVWGSLNPGKDMPITYIVCAQGVNAIDVSNLSMYEESYFALGLQHFVLLLVHTAIPWTCRN